MTPPCVPGAVSSDRLRARSLSSVPDGHSRTQEGLSIPPTAGVSSVASPRGFAISESPGETDSSSEEQGADIGPSIATLTLGNSRVYAAHSLPAHIWSLNVELYVQYEYVIFALFV
ncbi:hypothetical protein B566_EDAN016585 [Ephemera danica]|nr:hypothetical protein B566_EDAN016585 [Ephemera danica]